MKRERRTRLELAALESIVQELRRQYEDACRIVREYGRGKCARYRRERRRLRGIALRAVLKAGKP